MRRNIAVATFLIITLEWMGSPRSPAMSPQQVKKDEAKKAEAAPKVVESIDPRGEVKASVYKAIDGPKICLWYEKGEWAFQLRAGDVDWIPVDGWVEVEGGELTNVGGFNDLETRGTGSPPGRQDRGKFNKKRIDFDLWVKSARTDSFKFTVSEETRSIRFRFRIGKKLAATERILIGKDGRHPSQAEFSLKAHPDVPAGEREAKSAGGVKPKPKPSAKEGKRASSMRLARGILSSSIPHAEKVPMRKRSRNRSRTVADRSL